MEYTTYKGLIGYTTFESIKIESDNIWLLKIISVFVVYPRHKLRTLSVIVSSKKLTCPDQFWY